MDRIEKELGRIAKKHWNNLVDIQTIKNFYWVLLEHQIKYHGPAFLGEKIKIKLYSSINNQKKFDGKLIDSDENNIKILLSDEKCK